MYTSGSATKNGFPAVGRSVTGQGSYTLTSASVAAPSSPTDRGQPKEQPRAAEDLLLVAATSLNIRPGVTQVGPLPGGVLPCFFFAPAARDPPLVDCTSGMGVVGLWPWDIMPDKQRRKTMVSKH